MSHRIQRHEVRPFLSGRVRQHVHGLDAGDDFVSRRLGRPLRASTAVAWHLLLLWQGNTVSLFLYLAARDTAAFSLRSAHELWLEVPRAFCDFQYRADGYTPVVRRSGLSWHYLEDAGGLVGMTAILFILFAGLAIGCATSMIVQRNPLYSAISLIGVFISLACLYVMLAAPFIAAVQVIVYAGAIMVLVVFVIMLLNVEEEERKPLRLRALIPIAVALAAVLIAEVAFILVSVQQSPVVPVSGTSSDVGV